MTIICNLPHLEHIPSLTAFTARRLPGRDLEDLSGHADRPFHTQLLRLCTLNELAAYFLERGDFAGGERDTNFMDLWLVELRCLLWVLIRHCGGSLGYLAALDGGLANTVVRSRLPSFISTVRHMAAYICYSPRSVRHGKVMIGAEKKTFVLRLCAFEFEC